MTLANGLWSEEAVYLWGDTAFWQHVGTPNALVAFHAPKIIIGDGWPYALINTGTLEGMTSIAKALERHRPQDFWQLRECILEALAGCVGKTGERTLIASFAEKPRLTLIDTEDFLGHPPLTVMELRPYQICSNGHTPEVVRLIEAGVTVDSMKEVIRAQHADWNHDEGALIAGTITCVRVSRYGLDAFEVDNLPDLVTSAVERAV